MKRAISIALLATFLLASGVNNAFAYGLKYQRGYFKKSGTYVQGHYKTYSDSSKSNNRKALYGW